MQVLPGFESLTVRHHPISFNLILSQYDKTPREPMCKMSHIVAFTRAIGQPFVGFDVGFEQSDALKNGGFPRVSRHVSTDSISATSFISFISDIGTHASF